MHGKDIPSVMGELASKLINGLRLVASVFSEFKSVESFNNRLAKLEKTIILLSGSQNLIWYSTNKSILLSSPLKSTHTQTASRVVSTRQSFSHGE